VFGLTASFLRATNKAAFIFSVCIDDSTPLRRIYVLCMLFILGFAYSCLVWQGWNASTDGLVNL